MGGDAVGRLGWAAAGEDESVTSSSGAGRSCSARRRRSSSPRARWRTSPRCSRSARRGGRAWSRRRRTSSSARRDGISELAGLEPSRSRRGRAARPGRGRRALARSGAALLCLENTHTRAGGTVHRRGAHRGARAAARTHGARVHLDGARLPNAAVALGVPLAALAAPADTVALSLNKGLCGAVRRAARGRRRRRSRPRALHVPRLGGGTVHKAGHRRGRGPRRARLMVDRLAEDHRRARELARLLGLGAAETNIVTDRARRSRRSPSSRRAACSRSRPTASACAS